MSALGGTKTLSAGTGGERRAHDYMTTESLGNVKHYRTIAFCKITLDFYYYFVRFVAEFCFFCKKYDWRLSVCVCFCVFLFVFLFVCFCII